MDGIGAIVVTYDSAASIGECLDACLDCRAISSVTVVDNGSRDRTLAEVARRPSVRAIANADNRGFAAAVNQGARALSQSLLLVLNPDTVIRSGIESMAAACLEPGVGACGGVLVGLDTHPQHGFCVRAFPTAQTLAWEVAGINRIWPGNPINRRYRCADLDLDVDCDIDQPAGAFLMFRREAWERIGGFDERFHPIWFEDVDFCLRLRQAGYRIRLVTVARARHAGGQSIKNISWAAREQQWYASLLSYAAKHFPPNQRRGVALALALAAVPRAALNAASQRSFEPVSVYSRVIRLALRALLSAQHPPRPAPEGSEAACAGVNSIITRQDHLHGL